MARDQVPARSAYRGRDVALWQRFTAGHEFPYITRMSQAERVRRIIYSSRATGVNLREDHRSILAASRRNNGMDGVSGILWIQGDQYLQLLEGPPDSISETFARISVDPRHHDIQVLEDQSGVDRQFGDWAMAGEPGDRPEDALARLRGILRNADGEVARFFDPA